MFLPLVYRLSSLDSGTTDFTDYHGFMNHEEKKNTKLLRLRRIYDLGR
jgi:hypothetical protein